MPHLRGAQIRGRVVPSATAVTDRREAAQEQPSPTASRPVRCIVKLGGAVITNKGTLERIDEGSLRSACEQLRQAMSDGDGAPEKVLGMDWSRRHGDPTDPAVDAEGFAGMPGLGLDTKFIVVHGARIPQNLSQ